MKKKYFKSALCLGIGAVTLTAAVFANYDNANGYSICKNAAKGMLFETNYTAEVTLDMSIDSKKIVTMESKYQTNGGGNPSRYSSSYTASRSNPSEEFKTSGYVNIRQDNMSANTFKDYDGTSHSYTSEYYTAPSGYGSEDDGSIIGDRSEMAERAINFAEVLCDTMVGDLKNSIVLAKSDDNSKTYTVSLTANQMPELVSAGTSLIVASIKNDIESSLSYRDERDTPAPRPENYFWDTMMAGGEPVIDSVNGSITVDDRGKLTGVTGNLNVIGTGSDGRSHTMEASINLSISDLGSTNIEKVDINKLPNLTRHGRDTITVVIDTNSSEDEQADAREDYESYRENGYANVILMDTEGNILESYTNPDSKIEYDD